HANEHKAFIGLKGNGEVTYASITNVKASKTCSLEQVTQDGVFAQNKLEMLSDDVFAALKIYGTVERRHVRMMPAQQRPCTRLI
ncbi:acetolactate decarboxylase, partial [Staphylococcus aureus]